LARLYGDENFPVPAVEALRGLGHDVLTSSQDRALLTLNRKHFVKLHKTAPKHSGIIVCTVDPDFHAQANRIHATVLNAASLAGALIRVNRPA
jgi:hypothetical protein